MATKHYTGTANPIKQVVEITVTGTWATADTGTITINGNDLVVTVGSDTAVADIAEILGRAVLATSNDQTTGSGALKNDESRNVGGQEINEFTEITASYSAAVLTLTAVTAGKPFVVSVSETTAGTGSLGSPSTTVSATGPNHWDNADNWSDGAVPVSTDTVIIDSRSAASVLYGLDQNSVTLTSLIIKRNFQSPFTVGLAEVNADNSQKKYAEYRDTYLKISATTVEIGGGTTGQMSGRIKLNTGSNQTTLLIYTTGSTAETGVPSLLFLGTHASNAVHVMNEDADVGIAFFEGESSTVATLEANGILRCGGGTTLTNVDVNGGATQIDSATTTLDVETGRCTVTNGAHATVNVYQNGILDYRSTGTITTMEITGFLDCSRDPRGRTVTNALVLNRGATVVDPHSTLTLSAGFSANHCKLGDLTLDVGIDRSYTVT